MKRIALFAAALAAVLFLGKSKDRTDIAKLKPVEVVRVSCIENQVRLETDTQNIGKGNNIREAVADLEKTAAGMIFLDTADFLLIGAGGEGYVLQLKDFLRPGCLICQEYGTEDLQKAAAYLRIHKPDLTLLEYEAGEKTIPILITEEERMELVQT
ncbi:MAG: hypothetical protein IJX67_08005 [Oscillospiraceae bacterium]|nr:hypothetical protein [Oscillospiraceae bacterium]